MWTLTKGYVLAIIKLLQEILNHMLPFANAFQKENHVRFINISDIYCQMIFIYLLSDCFHTGTAAAFKKTQKPDEKFQERKRFKQTAG